MNPYERNLFETRYKDIGSDEQTWLDVFRRVSRTVTTDAELQRQFFDAMMTGEMVPSSPQLWNYGAKGRRFPRNGSSCFTGRMGDTLKSFRAADGDAEDVYVASGGMGLLANTVRPRGCKIRHCNEGAMGSMCYGGPIRRIEGTTGYITGAGRARGALMIQLSIWHPDVMEFILAKRPHSLGWLDNWTVNAKTVVRGDDLEREIGFCIDRFSSAFVHEKDWPSVKEAERVTGMSMHRAQQLGIIKIDTLNRAVPMVTDWASGNVREASRDWDLPLQNCNMSVRVTDAFMRAAKRGSPWAFSWFDTSEPIPGEHPWTKTDALGNGLEEINDGRIVTMASDLTGPINIGAPSGSMKPYRYGVVITTWEGLLQNLSPNQNQWRDTDYARFYRKVIVPAISRLSGCIYANQVWDLICENAWNHADPGIVYEDTYERFQPVDSAIYGPRLSNPCSEYVNSEGGSCNLISVNLRLCAERGLSRSGVKWQGEIPAFDSLMEGNSAMREQLREIHDIAYKAMTYISYALDYNEAPVPFIHEMTANHFRTVGTGIMGLAELLMLNHIRYGSPVAQQVAALVMSEVGLTCWERSFELAASGAKVPLGWNRAKMETIFEARAMNAQLYGLPNDHIERWRALAERVAAGEVASHTATTSVAPTGSIAQIVAWVMRDMTPDGHEVAVTSGVEPTFAWATGRTDNSGSTQVFHDLWASDEHHAQPWMVTASEVTMEEHIRMQAAVCAFTDMSVSKTVNLPEHATVQDVKHGYELAWELSIPGTALYRDRSKPMQVLTALECPSGECTIRHSQA